MTSPIRFPKADEFTAAARPLPKLPSSWKNICKAVIRQSRKTPSKPFCIDSDGSVTTYRDFVQNSAALSQVLKRKFGTNTNVGIIMPPMGHGATANMAVMMSGNVVVNLNLLSEAMTNMVIGDAGIKYVLTSRLVMTALKNPKVDAELVYLEDLRKEVKAFDKAFAFTIANVCPLRGMSEFLPGAKKKLSDTATIMYTSGSTGIPKGPELTHGNILSNIWQVYNHIHIKDHWKLLGTLPFFHSFGFTLTLMTVACLGLTVVFHPKGLDGKRIGELIDEHDINLVASTPTVWRTLMKSMTRAQVDGVEMLLFGSEKLKAELVRDVQDKLGLTPNEGYGCTETSPVLTANSPDEVLTADGRMVPGNEFGSVGILLPGTAIAVTDLDTGELLPPGKEGLVFVRGPQVMKGYHNRPEETARVMQNGWYYTGDVGKANDAARVWLTDRMNRVIKMGGEWVALVRIEAAIREVTGVTELEVVCTGVEDAVKGERPVAIFTNLGGMPIADIIAKLPSTGLPERWIPKARDWFPAESLPIGATGKLDLKELQKMANAGVAGSK
jgi:acyl-[acyl-carrier-protein]-phospholipid O-acyltransferase/long-chain-fatty-acid--[acyl-carrier-protein] ligase